MEMEGIKREIEATTERVGAHQRQHKKVASRIELQKTFLLDTKTNQDHLIESACVSLSEYRQTRERVEKSQKILSKLEEELRFVELQLTKCVEELVSLRHQLELFQRELENLQALDNILEFKL